MSQRSRSVLARSRMRWRSRCTRLHLGGCDFTLEILRRKSLARGPFEFPSRWGGGPPPSSLAAARRQTVVERVAEGLWRLRDLRPAG